MNLKLPLHISVPHQGLAVPRELEAIHLLSESQIAKDGDEGAFEIFSPLADHVESFSGAEIARAFVDLNRAEHDRRVDGVVKTKTCWNELIYRESLSEKLTQVLLEKYYRPYHSRLAEIDDSVRLCIDCHTMAEFGPPIGPDSGVRRPHVCLGDGNGKTVPEEWMGALKHCFVRHFGESVTVNEPFSGGFITRHHGRTRPWVQIEISRGDFMGNFEKGDRVLKSLRDFCDARPK